MPIATCLLLVVEDAPQGDWAYARYMSQYWLLLGVPMRLMIAVVFVGVGATVLAVST